MLEVLALRAGYGPVEVLHGVDLAIGMREIVALLGSNGAGKSTLNNNLCGLYRPFAGRISLDGEEIAGEAPDRIVGRGLVQVPEGRRVFPNLSVRENLGSAATAAAAPGDSKTSHASRPFFRALPSASASVPARFRAASSRCSRSAARSWPSRGS